MKLSIVIPVYNSEKILPTLVNKISSSLDKLFKKDLYEIILINDCSEDNSWKILKELAKNNNNLKSLLKYYQTKEPPIFPVKASDLMDQYKISEGKTLGIKLKKIEEIWIDNKFNISKKQINKVMEN